MEQILTSILVSVSGCDRTLHLQVAGRIPQGQVSTKRLPRGVAPPCGNFLREYHGNPDQTSLLLLYHSLPSIRKLYFHHTPENFLLPFGKEYSRITKAVLRRQLRSRSRAMDAREPCQAGNRAALSGMFHVPRGNRLRSCIRRTSFSFEKEKRKLYTAHPGSLGRPAVHTEAPG